MSAQAGLIVTNVGEPIEYRPPGFRTEGGSRIDNGNSGAQWSERYGNGFIFGREIVMSLQLNLWKQSTETDISFPPRLVPCAFILQNRRREVKPFPHRLIEREFPVRFVGKGVVADK